MKGRTTCPQCKHEFVLDLPEDCKKHDVVCPKCKKKFVIETKPSDPKSKGECSWEEHGEPRKTILSAIKPKTNRPRIVAVILIAVFVIGLSTAAFADIFIESSTGVFSAIGVKGKAELVVTDLSNTSLSGVSIEIGDLSGTTDENGFYSVENVPLGIQTVELSFEGDTLTYEILVLPFITSHNEIKMEAGTTVGFNSAGCSIILGVFSVFALLAAVVCYKRRNFDVAVAGSALSIFSFGFFLIGSILSIVALIIIIMCKEEFKDGKKGKIF
jgi:DNA-directed RNA polymerase subunit RPC12/RpoP